MLPYELCFRNPLELQQQVSSHMMISKHIVILLLLPLVFTARQCSDTSCFVKKLFDFSYPNEDVYSITLSGNQTQMNNFIKAYGDFNSDLRADYVSVDSSSNTIIFIYSTSSNLYELTYTIPPFQTCNPVNYFLFDINSDSNLDITVWGTNANGNNCMYPLIQNQTGIFNVGVVDTFNLTTPTTQPSLFEYNLPAGGGTIKTNCLLIYNNDAGVTSRFILYFQGGAYQSVPWSQWFSTTGYSSIAFSDQHWNTFIDLTNDCFPDFVITNSQQQIQFWIYNSTSSTFFLAPVQPVNALLSLNIIDINYDGALDLMIGQSTQISIYLGTRTLNMDSSFCVYGSYSFGFQSTPRVFDIATNFPNYAIVMQNLQYADLNVDGYPDMIMLVSINSAPNSLLIFENKFESGGYFELFDKYNSNINSKLGAAEVVTASFFDVLDNGIVDILVNVNSPNGVVSYAFYNNYLYQNSFYIKAYGTNGKSTSRGAQVPGVSFYWLNSVGNAQKVSITTQITQTSYSAYPMPYALTGLGRANNYVEMFTVGRLGEQASWSPIIPNSQLAIFAGNEPSSTWGIKIFIMPADSLVYVIIVCIVILTILGLILVGIKIHRKSNQQAVGLLNAI